MVTVGMIAMASIALNIQLLLTIWAVSKETRLLERKAAIALEGMENPESFMENFEKGLSTEFWDFTIIHLAGQASNETA